MGGLTLLQSLGLSSSSGMFHIVRLTPHSLLVCCSLLAWLPMARRLGAQCPCHFAWKPFPDPSSKLETGFLTPDALPWNLSQPGGLSWLQLTPRPAQVEKWARESRPAWPNCRVYQGPLSTPEMCHLHSCEHLSRICLRSWKFQIRDRRGHFFHSTRLPRSKYSPGHTVTPQKCLLSK